MIHFNLIQVISIFAIFQALFLSLYFILLKKGDRKINLILSSLLVCFAILIAISLSLTEGLEYILIDYHKPIFLLRQIALLIGPLLLWFVKRLLNSKYKPNLHSAWHLLPFVISLLYNGILIIPMSQFILWLSDLRFVNTVLILIHLLSYIIVSIFVIKKNKLPLKFSLNGSRTSILTLISIIMCGTVMIWLVEVNSLVILSILKYFQYCPNMTGLYSASSFIFINSIALFIYTKPELFTRYSKYYKSGLSNSSKNHYLIKLETYMLTEKPFLDPACSLTSLSKKIQISSNNLSQLINETYHQNFYNYVNAYRVEESKNLIKEYDQNNMTILGIAYKVGFNSKTTFNKSFKKVTGYTPTEYKKLMIKTGKDTQDSDKLQNF